MKISAANVRGLQQNSPVTGLCIIIDQRQGFIADLSVNLKPAWIN
jgi:hypothetical protein